MKIIYRKLHEDTLIPAQQTEGAACSDVFAYLKNTLEVSAYNKFNQTKTITVINRIQDSYIDIQAGWRVLVPTGWSVKLPHDYSIRLYSRSGLALKQGLVVGNSVGIVDSDYEFQVFVIVSNISESLIRIKHQDRIAQLDYVKNLHNSFDYDIVSMSDQEWFSQMLSRKGGFGSTGK